jgi:hypothetical protein
MELPKLTSTVRVDMLKNSLTDSNKLLFLQPRNFRRRLNSEEEESLIVFGNYKSNFKANELLQTKRKHSIQPTIIKEEPTKAPEPHSRMIYDHISVTKMSKVSRKQSVDSSVKLNNKYLRINDPIQDLKNNKIAHLSNMNLDSCFITQNEGNPFKTTFCNPKQKFATSNKRQNPRLLRKDSELIKDNEQDATKNSSFNTEINCKNTKSINNILNHSEHNLREISQGSPQNKRKQVDQISLFDKKIYDTKQRPNENVENDNKRKNSLFCPRQIYVDNEKSVNEVAANQEEKILSNAFMNSIGSYISEETNNNLIDRGLESHVKRPKKSFTQADLRYDGVSKSRSRNPTRRKSAHLYSDELQFQEKDISSLTGKKVIIHINFLIIRGK